MDRASIRNLLHLPAHLPFTLAFLAGPLLHALLFFLGRAEETSILSLRLWFLFCGVTILSLLLTKAAATKRMSLLCKGGAVLFCAGTSVLVLLGPYIAVHLDSILFYLGEGAPWIFALLALACVGTYGLPSPAVLHQLGSYLGALVMLDTVYMYGTGSSLRILGDHNTLATLLLVALSAGFSADDESISEKKPHRFWILAGLAATLSRTGLLTAGLAYLCFGKSSPWKRLGYAAICLGIIIFSFSQDIQHGNPASRYLEYWLWFKGGQMLLGNPLALYTGFPLATPLPMVPSLSLMGVWQTITSTLPFSGIMIQDLPFFWLRLTMGWGILVPCGLLLAFISGLRQRTSPMGATLLVVCITQGVSTPLFYDPNAAVLLCLALFLAFTPQQQAAQPAPPSPTVPEHD